MVTKPPLTIASADIVRSLTGPGGAFEVVAAEVDGVEMRVYKTRPQSLRQVFDSSTSGTNEGDHLVYGDRRISFESIRAGTLEVAAGLWTRHTVTRGDRVAVLAPNTPEWVLSFWATTYLGGILVGLNGWWKSDEIVYGLQDSGARVLVTDANRLNRIVSELPALPELEAIYLIDGSPSDYGDSRIHRFGELTGNIATVPVSTPQEADPAVIFYTSGTTGRPKVAVSTHRSMIANLQNTMFNNTVARSLVDGSAPASGAAQPARTTLLLTSPMFHVSGCHSGIVVGLAGGFKLVIPVGRFDPDKALQLIEDERVTMWATVPTMIWRVVEHSSRDNYDTSSVRAIAYGGSPTAGELQRRIQETFPNVGMAMRNAYGLTESSSVATSISGQDLIDRPESVGQPTPVVDIQIVDELGETCAPGFVGEVCIRGPIVMPGYWHNPQATAESMLPGGWLRTGDLGHVDESGFLYITDRKKDIIIRGGENVYCVEIENRLVEHPAIADAAVIGVPHPTLGEEVRAVIELAPGHTTLDQAEVQGWVASRLADFKVPRYVTITTDKLPRNASGKLLKNVLRDGVESALTETL